MKIREFLFLDEGQNEITIENCEQVINIIPSDYWVNEVKAIYMENPATNTTIKLFRTGEEIQKLEKLIYVNSFGGAHFFQKRNIILKGFEPFKKK